MPGTNGQFIPWSPDGGNAAEPACAPSAVEERQAALEIPDLPACALANGKAPAVGSPAWCACLNSLVEWVTELGQSAFDWLFPDPSAPQTTDWLTAALQAFNPANAALKGVVALAESMSDDFRQRVQTSYETIKGLMDSGGICNPSAILGVEIARALVNALNKVRLGTDALVWATLDLKFTVSVLHRILSYVEGYVCPVEIPSYGEIVGCYIANTATEGQLRCWSAMQGHDWDVNAPARLALRRKPELLDLFTLRNREVISDATLDKQLRSLGFTDTGERTGMPQLRYEVPGPSDLVRFAVRHVFEPDLIKEFGYNDEYRPILDAFHHAQGVDYPIFTDVLKDVVTYTEQENDLAPGTFAASYEQVGLPEPTWARAYWWSHWILPSPTQGYEMLFRLDPTRDKTGESPWMAAQDFDLEHLRLLLRANDYPPYWRDKLAAIAYRPPNLRFLRVQLQTKTITEAQAVSQLRQMGFRPDYAAMQAKAIVAQLDEQEAQKLLKIILKDLEAGWELGLVSDDQFSSTLINAGIDPDEADARVNAAIYSRSVRAGRELVAETRKAYLRGRFSESQALDALTQVGIADRRRQEYIRVWRAIRQSRLVESTAGQLRKATIDGTLDLPTYAQRLRNLDYSDSAIELLLADVRLARSSQEQRSLRAMAADLERSEKSRIAALRATERALAEQRAELSRHGSPSKLKTWYCAGDISSAEVTARLIALNWPQADIDRLLGECDAKRAKLGLQPYQEEAPGAEA